MSKITTILVSGFLGAGKTSLLKHLLTHEKLQDHNIAVLVNDFGSLPVDGALLPQGRHYTAEINKGSIFCVCVKTDLLKNLEYIADNIKPDLLLIEATGVAEPADFSTLLQTEHLKACYRKGLTITIVDLLNFLKLHKILTALTAQVQAADVILLNKTDLADGAESAKVESAINKINSRAKIVKTCHSQISLEEIDIFMETDDDNYQKEKIHSDLYPAAPQGTVKYEFRSNAPIDKINFYNFLDTYRNIILRGKGIVTFGPSKLFVEVVNGVVSSKPASGINLESPQLSAMSFILRNDANSDEFIVNCGKFC